MYITNPKKYNQDKLYKCNGVQATWLIETKGIPIFGREDGIFYFAITRKLKEALLEMPFYMKEVI